MKPKKTKRAIRPRDHKKAPNRMPFLSGGVIGVDRCYLCGISDVLRPSYRDAWMGVYDPDQRDPNVEAAKRILTAFALDYPEAADALFGARNAKAVSRDLWDSLRLDNDLIRPQFRYAGRDIHAYLAVVSLRMALETWDDEFASDWWVDMPPEFTSGEMW